MNTACLDVVVHRPAHSFTERRAVSVEDVVGGDPVHWIVLCLEMMISVCIPGYQR